MKWLLIIALLLNIIFYGYNTFFLEKTTEEPKAVSSTSEKKQMILLSELDANELKELQAKSSPGTDLQKILDPQKADAETKISAIEPKHCFKLGPFNKQKMDEIKLTLEKLYQNQLSFGIETTSAITYYRIYIPPVESKEKRNETISILDKSGMKDHYVMSIDGRKNAIALGVFKKRSAAESIAAKAKGIGLATTIEAISDDKDSLYNLQLEFQDKTDLAAYNSLISKQKIKSAKCEK